MVAGLLLGVGLVAPPPASAHSVAGVSGTNYKTELHSVTPRVQGITLKVIETGSRMELTNTTGTEAVVLGYDKEPYLRVGPDGVYENVRSPATYINATRTGSKPIPSTASSSAAPQWRKVSSATTARWHDHRVHFMGKSDPPVVRRAPGTRHVIVEGWRVEVQHDGQTIAAVGDLVYVPAPAVWPWLVLVLVLLGVCVLAGLSNAWASMIAGLLIATVGVDVAHEVGIGFANAGSPAVKVGRVVLGSFFTVIAWVIAVPALRQLAKRTGDGLLMAAFVGAVIGLFGGVGDLPSLFNSQVPFAFAPALARALTAVSLGLGFGLVAGSVLAIMRHKVFEGEAGAEPVEPVDADAPA